MADELRFEIGRHESIPSIVRVRRKGAGWTSYVRWNDRQELERALDYLVSNEQSSPRNALDRER